MFRIISVLSLYLKYKTLKSNYLMSQWRKVVNIEKTKAKAIKPNIPANDIAGRLNHWFAYPEKKNPLNLKPGTTKVTR